MKVNFQGQSFSSQTWRPNVGNIGQTISIYVGRTNANKPEQSEFVFATVFSGGEIVYLLQTCFLQEFLLLHFDSDWIMYHAGETIQAIYRESKLDFDFALKKKKLWSIDLLHLLLELAINGTIPSSCSLTKLVKYYLKVVVDGDLEDQDFSAYRRLNKIFYRSIRSEELAQSYLIAILIFHLFKVLKIKVQEFSPIKFLSHQESLMGEIALSRVASLGLGFDLKRRDVFLTSLNQEVECSRIFLAKYGVHPGEVGVIKQFERAVEEIGLKLPRAKGGGISTKIDDLMEFNSHPFINAFIKLKEMRTLSSFIEKLQTPRVHTIFRSLLSTGRISSSSPNIQNFPKNSIVRRCIVPAIGHRFLVVDYSSIELCTLAQEAFDRYGFSMMRDLINDGRDLHRWFASELCQKQESLITDNERQLAKAANFGFPGGLGINSFIEFARSSYGLDLSETKAKELKAKWLTAFPEMRLYLKDSLFLKHDFESLNGCNNPEVACGLFKRILGGENHSKTGFEYDESTVRWALDTVMADVKPEFKGYRRGSPQLKEEILKESVITRTGRVRSNVTYTQARNTPFQGLAADGAKIALYLLLQANYRVVNFVHDEFLIEIPEDNEELMHAEALKVAGIVLAGMQSVVPDVKISAKWYISDWWGKGESYGQ